MGPSSTELLRAGAPIRAAPVASIFASTLTGGIGNKGRLPWRLKEDLESFERITKTVGKDPNGMPNGVIMGRKTWDSIPTSPLKDRINCVVTSHPDDLLGKNQFAKTSQNTKLDPSNTPSARSTGPKTGPTTSTYGADLRGSLLLRLPFVNRLTGMGRVTIDHSAFPLAVKSLQEGLNRLRNCSTIYITGGAGLYNMSHEAQIADYIIWTRVCGEKIATDVHVDLALLEKNYECLGVSKTKGSGRYTFDVAVLRKKGQDNINKEYEAQLSNFIRGISVPVGRDTSFQTGLIGLQSAKEATFRFHDEYQYLDIMKDIVQSGVEMEDRTGVGTLSKFGALMRYDLSESFPLLTTKKVYWKGVVEELLWFLKGCTDGKKLAAKNVHIWDGNGTKEFLTKRGLGHRREGDLGPVYGFQWRHFGADYVDCDCDYKGAGVDQVQTLLKDIKQDPVSRRHIISAWNPAALKDMALPPCHVLSQFVVDPMRKEISCALYQRSGDWGLGIPFNIASYSLLCYIIGHLTGYKPKEFVHFVANAHVYKNHLQPLKEQFTRAPRPFPKVVINPDITDIDQLEFKDVKLIGYDPYPAIKMEMAV
ncbi:dihydrofolate reductase-thymidylate synthase [Gregarina niphandrodes]|uniref:Bifunctional dihydrofolate reductase-thymidylate synthase n=1 Tax=Gregarina niphandrodes TaxID=110365 RepID=A0A023AYK9_GRENI|nr:dihydrofolate reductase-thymidylate synthase [Gregarina niphandrodes]EZG43751.1 dihydrofolate reductase-thymidylate synthase [Gregarina niphandrodes]|eukprot:XP_011134636.1 dihydrofolate reductase-thymidylate synthase [Gregarina niphandrodes]